MSRMKPCLIVLSALLLVASPLPATAQFPEEKQSAEKQIIKAKYDKLFDASRKKDKKAVLTWFQENTTPDWVFSVQGQTSIPRGEALNKIEHSSGDVFPSDHSLKSMTQTGDTIVVEAVYKHHSTYQDTAGEYGPKGKTQPSVSVDRMRSIWRKTEQRWQCSRMEILETNNFINGKPYKERKP